MLRLLTTPLTPNEANEEAINTTNAYAAHRNAICYQYAQDFITSPIKYLFKSCATREAAEQLFKDLKSVVQFAGELSSRLWARKTSMATRGLADLKETTFSADSNLLRAHALHKLYDEEDDRCDGCAVSVVVHPAVLGFGSSDGDDYQTSRVWMKAEVLVTEGAASVDGGSKGDVKA